ncbi:MAG: WecB/TagA/CpsF family glycosyltransferase [Anaerolineae bacterium]
MPRAPAWRRRIGLEWFYRLIRQPWRWRRMLVLPVFGWKVMTQALGKR